MELKDKIYFGEPIQDRFYNGFSEMETAVVTFSNKTGAVRIEDLFVIAKGTERMLSKEEDIWIKDIVDDIQVTSRNGLDKVLQIVRRRVYEPLVRIEAGSRVTVVSSSHGVMTVSDGSDVLKVARDVKVGDQVLVSVEGVGTGLQPVTQISAEEGRHLHLYGLVTVSGGAFISGIFQKSY
ncbi:MAG: Hint domain-containing protein [Candidatus Cryosericum sp.]